MTQYFVGVMTNVDARSYDESFTVYGPWTREQANERALSVVLEHNEWQEVSRSMDDFGNIEIVVQYDDKDDWRGTVKIFPHFRSDDIAYIEMCDGEEALVIEPCQS